MSGRTHAQKECIQGTSGNNPLHMDNYLGIKIQ